MPIPPAMMAKCRTSTLVLFHAPPFLGIMAYCFEHQRQSFASRGWNE